MELWISFALLGIGLLAIIIELFVPAGGLIGIAGGVCIVSAVVLAYVHHSTARASIVLVTAIITTPFTIGIALKVFPKSFIGKRLILTDRSIKEEPSSEDSEASEKEEEASSKLVGKEGITLTPLRPSGMVRIGEKKYSVVTQGNYIDKNKKVTVFSINGNRIVVKEIS